MSIPLGTDRKASRARARSLSVREMIIFAFLATIMFISKLVMEFLPNVHLLGVLTMTYTLVYRSRALIPIYLYVFMNGLYAGFNLWWIPYLYIWALLWGATMLLPKRMPRRIMAIVYPVVCSLHGFAYGILYSPAQALMFGLDLKGMLAWIAAGVAFDIIHGISNFAVGFLILPLSELLRRLSVRKIQSK